MFALFTDRARRVVVMAQDEARLLDHAYIGSEHIMLGLIREGEGSGSNVPECIGISLDAARQEVEEIVGRGQQPPGGHVPFTPDAKKALELSLNEAFMLGHDHIGPEHILLGLLRLGEGVAAQVFTRLDVDLERTRQRVIHVLSDHPPGAPPAA